MHLQSVDRHLGLRIKQLRQEGGQTRDEVARRTGLDIDQIERLERGSYRVGAAVLWLLSAALGVEPGQFYEGLPPPLDIVKM